MYLYDPNIRYKINKGSFQPKGTFMASSNFIQVSERIGDRLKVVGFRNWDMCKHTIEEVAAREKKVLDTKVYGTQGTD